jgi:fructokinase
MVIVTHGEKGATLYTARGKHHHPGYKVDVVDTTGAGDAFVAGLLVAMLEQEQQHGSINDHVALLRFANAVGALATTAKGAIPALPGRVKVDAFLAAQK